MSIAATIGWQLLRFALYVGLYVLLFDNSSVVLFGLGWNFYYLGFLLFLPINTPVALQLLLGFGLGFSVDIAHDTGGLHAVAAVLVAYLRPYVLRLLTPRDGYDAQDTVNVHQMGWQWFLVYLAILVTVHHVVFFFLELGSLQHPLVTLARVGVSIGYTSVVMLIVQLLFFPVRRGRG